MDELVWLEHDEIHNIIYWLCSGISDKLEHKQMHILVALSKVWKIGIQSEL